MTVYLVMDDLGDLGRVFKETEADHSDLEAVIQDLLEGQYKNPMRIVGFNVPEGWARDVSADVALEVQQRRDLQLRDIPFFLQEFVDLHRGRYHDVQLPIRLVEPSCLPLSDRNVVPLAFSRPFAKQGARLSGAKFLAAIVIGLLIPFELAAQGLPVRTGSHVPVWIWFIGSGVLGLALAYGIIRTRGRSRGERQATEQATKNLYAEEERERAKSGEP